MMNDTSILTLRDSFCKRFDRLFIVFYEFEAFRCHKYSFWIRKTRWNSDVQ